jgi:hypothetical protein
MEGLIARGWIAAALVAAGGAYTMYSPPKRSMPIDETWMVARSPSAIGPYTFTGPSEVDAPEGQSYRMSKSTYDTLKPSGIVSRHYASGFKKYDVVLIASDNSVSFHDPRVCFTASGYTITDQKQITIPTKSHGEVPMTLVRMEGRGEKCSALYFYRGPNGFQAVARKMRWDMLVGQMVKGRNDQGVFYRFIPVTPNITDDELKQFAASYLDEANRVSGGFF